MTVQFNMKDGTVRRLETVYKIYEHRVKIYIYHSKHKLLKYEAIPRNDIEHMVCMMEDR